MPQYVEEVTLSQMECYQHIFDYMNQNFNKHTHTTSLFSHRHTILTPPNVKHTLSVWKSVKNTTSNFILIRNTTIFITKNTCTNVLEKPNVHC